MVSIFYIGVVMLVTGLFTPSDSNIARPFVQTFFLSSQHGDNQHVCMIRHNKASLF